MYFRCLQRRTLSAFPRACQYRRPFATQVHTTRTVKPTQYGQPVSASHPHLIKAHEVTPGIPHKEYDRRRKALMDSLPENSIVVSVAGQVKYMSGRNYKFRQASDFWYLTGFEEPDSAVILEKNSSPRGYRMSLFCSGKDSAKEQWDGARTSFADAMSKFGMDDAQHISGLTSAVKRYGAAATHVYMDVPHSLASSRRGRSPSQAAIQKILALAGLPAQSEHVDSLVESIAGTKRKPLAPEVSKLRAIKSTTEQQIMRAAADISGRAHAKTMRFTEPGMSEHSVAAHFDYICSLSGAQRLAYVPVVASGPNSLIIHYTSNNQLIEDGEMILLDAGCEYNGYASDITRTYPASGKFNPAQAELYSALLAVQKKMITYCTEASQMSLAEIHRESSDMLQKELNKIGFNLRGTHGAGDVARVLYPHYVGHPIGVDLHESTNHDRNGSLKAGMVITIEPGVYVPAHPSYPKQFHNMGIRIEDEVLVDKNHPVVLSVNAPKEIPDIEGACQGSIGLTAI
ncbi:peptidase M24, structural domain-containing protein [Cristinia sonorae]|uniref:Peptidase M24, structural domain-containing protein n=1 Tax=Cristinia sonorae TaxID=1940300 RepID=A0A8K0UUG8_9AGAR|nr:peptidase M24, structural domain-containing protein [Cristinia sonorae]